MNLSCFKVMLFKIIIHNQEIWGMKMAWLILVEAFIIQPEVTPNNQISSKDQTTNQSIYKIEKEIFREIEIKDLTIYKGKVNVWDQGLIILQEEEVSVIKMAIVEKEWQVIIHLTEVIIPENINHLKKDTWEEELAQEMTITAQENMEEISKTRIEMETTQFSAITVETRVILLETALNLLGETTRVVTIEILEEVPIMALARIVICLIIVKDKFSDSIN